MFRQFLSNVRTRSRSRSGSAFATCDSLVVNTESNEEQRMTTLSSGFPCHPVAPHPLVPAVCVGDTTQSNTTTITTSRSSSRNSRKVAKAAAGSGYRCKKGRGEMGGSGQTYDKPQTASSNSKHEPLLAVLSIGKHGAANTNSEQGGGCRVLGAGCSVLRQRWWPKQRRVSERSPRSSCISSSSPAAEHAKPLSGDLAMSVLLPVKAQGWVGMEEQTTSVLCCMCNCVPVCVCVCQFSQLTATVAEPRTLDSINCTCQTGEIINAIAAASAAHYCN